MKKALFSLLLFTGAIAITTAQLSVSPNLGNRGQSLPIIISGQNANFSSQGSPSVALTQGSFTINSLLNNGLRNVSVMGPNTITADLSLPANAPLGSYDLFVNAGTSTTQPQAFTVDQPSSNSITSSPGGGQPGTATNVTITVPGASFKNAMQGVTSVWLSLNNEIINTFTNIQVTGPTSFTADLALPANATQGFWNVNVFSGSGIMYSRPGAFDIDNSFALAELNPKVALTLYPNPGHDEIALSFEPNLSGKLQIRMFSLTGKEVFPGAITIDQQAGKSKIYMPEELPKGAYLIQLLVNEKVAHTSQWIRN